MRHEQLGLLGHVLLLLWGWAGDPWVGLIRRERLLLHRVLAGWLATADRTLLSSGLSRPGRQSDQSLQISDRVCRQRSLPCWNALSTLPPCLQQDFQRLPSHEITAQIACMTTDGIVGQSTQETHISPLAVLTLQSNIASYSHADCFLWLAGIASMRCVQRSLQRRLLHGLPAE